MALRIIALVYFLTSASNLIAHASDAPPSQLVEAWRASLTAEQREQVFLKFEDERRFKFNWLPGRRAGLRLDDQTDGQRHLLRDFLQTQLSAEGANKVDAIIATEAALAVLSSSPEYRNPGKYYSAIFGEPGSQAWAYRLEGHHLSVNLTFSKERLISATPLFIGANPETVPSGPDKGLRALKNEVDLARQLYRSLSTAQKDQVQKTSEWFAGFLTSPASRRAELPKPAGLAVKSMNKDQQTVLKQLIEAYVFTLNVDFAQAYMQGVEAEWNKLYFFWKGDAAAGGDYYYRIAGENILIEQETQGSDTHIHAVWRDVEQDFSARP